MTRINDDLSIGGNRQSNGTTEGAVISDGEYEILIGGTDVVKAIQALAYYAGNGLLPEILTAVEALMPDPTENPADYVGTDPNRGTVTRFTPLEPFTAAGGFPDDPENPAPPVDDLDIPDVDVDSPLPAPTRIRPAPVHHYALGPGMTAPAPDPVVTAAAAAQLVDATTGQPVDLEALRRRASVEADHDQTTAVGHFPDADTAINAAADHAAALVKARAASQQVAGEFAFTAAQQATHDALNRLDDAIEAQLIATVNLRLACADVRGILARPATSLEGNTRR